MFESSVRPARASSAPFSTITLERYFVKPAPRTFELRNEKVKILKPTRQITLRLPQFISSQFGVLQNVVGFIRKDGAGLQSFAAVII
ncbi:hypothetical protein ACTXT7_002563 [Hymenolepis weldensis]